MTFPLQITFNLTPVLNLLFVPNKIDCVLPRWRDNLLSISQLLTYSSSELNVDSISATFFPEAIKAESSAGLDIGLVGPVARGASRFENLLAPQKTYWPGGPVDLKTYWPPKKLTGPYLKTKLARRKTICINLQFAHRPIIKLFRSHPRNIFQI